MTGSARSFRFHLTKVLLGLGMDALGVDDLNDYYDPQLKINKIENLNVFVKEFDISQSHYFSKLDIRDEAVLKSLFQDHKFEVVINLAAQTGVRYSLEQPKAYIDSNIVCFANILKCCRHTKVSHLLLASSSSVYGLNTKKPFSTEDNTDYPISLYLATKKSNELLAHSYSHLCTMPLTGVRFFTVYGPYSHLDMVHYSFTKAISKGNSIDVFNLGIMQRDFTYIDDIVEGIVRLIDLIPLPQALTTPTQ